MNNFLSLWIVSFYLLHAKSSFLYPQNIRESPVFWCFREVRNEARDIKWVKGITDTAQFTMEHSNCKMGEELNLLINCHSLFLSCLKKATYCYIFRCYFQNVKNNCIEFFILNARYIFILTKEQQELLLNEWIKRNQREYITYV